MNKKICIVTGANSGIGYQAAIQIGQEGYHVILACRNEERGNKALTEIREINPSFSGELQVVDIGQRASICKFAEEFNNKYEKLDVLIHNAAIFNVTQKQREETLEGIETVWATNHLGPVLLTQLLLPKLKKSENGRVLTIASKGLLAKPFLKVSLEDAEYKNRKFSIVNAYYQSKLAQIMYTYWLAERLINTKVTANCIRVTAVKIDISRHPGLTPLMKKIYLLKAKQSIEPELMARTYTQLAVSSKYIHTTGKYFDENLREVDSNKYSKNKENITKVIEMTSNYIPEMNNL